MLASKVTVFDSLPLPDGRSIGVGSSQVDGSGDTDFGVLYLDAQKNPDPSVLNGGVTIDFDLGGGNRDSADKVALQSDGKILVAGSAEVSSTSFVLAAARLNPDGSPDETFQGDGRTTVTLGTGDFTNILVTDIVVRPDGKILLVGQATSPDGIIDFAARLNPGGSSDRTFGDNGTVVLPFQAIGHDAFESQSHLIQPDGKLVFAGSGILAATQARVFTVARLDQEGQPDASFNGIGLQIVAFDPSVDADANAVAIQPDGKIVVAGRALVAAGDNDFAVARLNPDGSLDRTFDDDGRQTIGFTNATIPGAAADDNQPHDDTATSVVIDGAGKIRLGGKSLGTNGRFVFFTRGDAVLNPDGSLDTSFDGDGRKLSDTATGGGPLPGYPIVIIKTKRPAGKSPPTVLKSEAVARGRRGGGITSIRLTYNAPLDSSSASDGSHYLVTAGIKRRGRLSFSKPLSISNVSYEASSRRVLILLARPAKGTVKVTASPGILGANGVPSTDAFSAILVPGRTSVVAGRPV